jgi:rhodanese-related sulfurtransferase
MGCDVSWGPSPTRRTALPPEGSAAERWRSYVSLGLGRPAIWRPTYAETVTGKGLVWVAALLLALLGLAGCGSSDTRPGDVGRDGAPATAGPATPLLAPADFAAAVAEPSRITVNVHVPFEGAIAGTDLTIAYDRIGAEAGRLPRDTATPLAVYCRSGRMSAVAVRTLAALGYRNVVELSNGMDAWTAAGFPLLSRPGG